MSDFNKNETQYDVTIPMPEVPHGKEWTKEINPRDIPVAEHELGHVFVAFSMGIGLRFATVIPNYGAGYRGLTVLEHGSINPHDLQIISAAGSHKSHEGNSDDRRVHGSSGSKEFDESLVQAQAIIGTLKPEEWKLMVQIFAYKKTIEEADIPQMIRRARFDLGRGVTPDEKLFVQQIASIREQIRSSETIGVIRDEVIEEEQEDGTIKRYHRVNGIVDVTSVEVICAYCGMRDGHASNCEANKKNR